MKKQQSTKSEVGVLFIGEYKYALNLGFGEPYMLKRKYNEPWRKIKASEMSTRDYIIFLRLLKERDERQQAFQEKFTND